MARKLIVSGTGITARKKVTFEAPFTTEDQEGIKQSFREMARHLDLDDVLGDIEAVAVSVLAEADLPTKYELYKFDNGGCWGVVHVARRRGFEDDTPEGYAAHAVDGIAFIRMEREQGNIDRAILEAMRLVAVLSEADFKHKFERATLAGLGVSKGGKKGADSTWGTPEDRAEVRGRMLAMFEEKRRAGVSKSEAEEIVARAFSVTPRTVRKVRTGR